jgi:hypothetical protein
MYKELYPVRSTAVSANETVPPTAASAGREDSEALRRRKESTVSCCSRRLLAQLVVDQRQQPAGRVRIGLTQGVHEMGDVTHQPQMIPGRGTVRQQMTSEGDLVREKSTPGSQARDHRTTSRRGMDAVIIAKRPGTGQELPLRLRSTGRSLSNLARRRPNASGSATLAGAPIRPLVERASALPPCVACDFKMR